MPKFTTSEHIDASQPTKLTSLDKVKSKISHLSNGAQQAVTPDMKPTTIFDGDIGIYSADTVAQTQLANMVFNPALLKGQLKKTNLAELYKNAAAKKRGQIPLGMIADPVSLVVYLFCYYLFLFDPSNIHLKPSGKVEKWTDQLLVESKPLSRFINIVLRDLRALCERVHRASTVQHEFEWSIMVDK